MGAPALAVERRDGGAVPCSWRMSVNCCQSQQQCVSSLPAGLTPLCPNPQVDLDALRELSWSGIPQELRPTCWKLLLGYLPPNK